jgi:hypothetical protein
LTPVDYVLTHHDLVEKLRQQMGFLERSAQMFDEGHEEEAFRLAGIVRTLVHDTRTSHSLLGQLGVKETLRYLDTSEPILPENLAPTIGLAEVRLYPDPSPRGSYAAPLGGDSYAPRSARDSTSRHKTSKRRRSRAPRGAEVPTILRGLVLVEGSEPPKDQPPPPYSRERQFEPWWTDPVTKDSRDSLFSRSRYILAGANKEGGTHIDPTLEAEWAELTRNNTLNYHVTRDGMEIVVGSPGPDDLELPLGDPALPSIRQIAYELEGTVRSQLDHLL